jgi:hypothetical protein
MASMQRTVAPSVKILTSVIFLEQSSRDDLELVDLTARKYWHGHCSKWN